MIKLSVQAIIAWALFIVVVLVMAFMWMFGVGLFQRETAGFRGDVKATEQVQGSGQYRIAAYDHFFDLCSSIQSTSDQIKNLEAQVASEEDPVYKRDLRQSVAALQNQRASAIRQYNADAAKEGTVGQFRDSGLPHSIDPSEEDVTCAL